MTLSVGIQSVSPTPTTNASGEATGSITLTQQAGTVNFVSSFSGDTLYLSTSDTDAFTIGKEDATVSYTGNADSIMTAGPTVTTATVILSAHVDQIPDGYPGDISKATVKFMLTPSVGSTIYAIASVNASGDAITSKIVGVDSYVITYQIDPVNGYWISEVDQTTLAVIAGTTDQRVTGGGWVPDSSSFNGKTSFAFNVQYNKNNAPKGNVLLLYRGTDGYNYLIKSTAWSNAGLNFLSNYTANFSSKGVVQKINRHTGEVTSWGNCQIIVIIRDGDLATPKQADSYSMIIQLTDGTNWKSLGTPTSLITLGGGNITVHSTNSK